MNYFDPVITRVREHNDGCRWLPIWMTLLFFFVGVHNATALVLCDVLFFLSSNFMYYLFCSVRYIVYVDCLCFYLCTFRPCLGLHVQAMFGILTSLIYPTTDALVFCCRYLLFNFYLNFYQL